VAPYMYLALRDGEERPLDKRTCVRHRCLQPNAPGWQHCRCCCRDQANPVRCSSLTADQPLQVLVGLGSALAYAAGGRDLALPFALGGASDMLYQYMLEV